MAGGIQRNYGRPAGTDPRMGGPGQPVKAPPSQYTDAMGDVYQWEDGGFTAENGVTNGVTQGKWNKLGNPGQIAAAPRPGAGGVDTNFDWEKYVPKEVPREVLPPHVTGDEAADRTAAEQASLAQSKQRIGQVAQGALKSLYREMGSRGISGSGLESRGQSRIVRGAAGDIGNQVNSLAIDALHRKDSVNDRNYAGDISQRTTDIGFNQGQRGQDINFQIARANSIPGLVSLRRRAY